MVEAAESQGKQLRCMVGARVTELVLQVGNAWW